MSLATVTAAIAGFDAIGRTRALSDDESRQLQNLITTERRYRGQNRKRPPQPTVAAVCPIERQPPRTIAERISATLVRMALDGAVVRAIYLMPDDHAVFAEQIGGETFDDYPVRLSRAKGRAASLIYDKFGRAWTVRK